MLSSCTSISQLLNSFSSFLMAACTEREIFLERKGLRLQQPPQLSQSINTKLNLIYPSTMRAGQSPEMAGEDKGRWFLASFLSLQGTALL